VILLIVASRRKVMSNDNTTGHTWDVDLREMNNPLPRWWVGLFVITVIFAAVYLLLYPGLGSKSGVLNWTSSSAHAADLERWRAQMATTYATYTAMPAAELVKDDAAMAVGERLFANYCAQCHGSDARGAVSFPNLAQGDSMYGRTPEALHTSIAKGRNGVMPPMGANINPKSAGEIAQYVRSMSGLAHDQIRVIPGKREYLNNCVACHGVDGKGNKALGAPNLTDDVWLYGSSEATIVGSILNGRNNRMPAQEHVLTPEQIRLLSAWVWGLSGGKDVTVSAAMSGNTTR
jgi:cytochrome c oxidase cbb3-type subunit 3